MTSSAAASTASEQHADSLALPANLPDPESRKKLGQIATARRQRVARLSLGAALLALGAIAYAITEGGVDPQRFSLLALSLAGVALVASMYEASSILIQRSRLENPLELFPAAGTFLISLGAITSLLSFSFEVSASVASGPVLAAGLLLILRGFLTALDSGSEDGRELLMPPSGLALRTIQRGEKLSLSEGVVVPADCRIETGCVSVLERYLSPETTFRVKEEGEVVFAGSEIVGGSAGAVALSGDADSCLRNLESLVASSVDRASVSLHAEDLQARRATAYILIFIAIASAILWDERLADPWSTLASAGLVLFAGVVSQLADLLYAKQRETVRRWASEGFVATSDSAVRDLASASQVLFDPSRVDLGSLVQIRELELLDDRVGQAELCACLAALLGRAEDVSLTAAGSFCQKIAGTVAPERALDLSEVSGGGIRGSLRGVPVTVGTEEFLLEQGILIHPSESNVESAENERPLLVAIGGELVARFWVSFGQLSLASDESRARDWHGIVSSGISSGVPGEVTDSTLLVRGQESDVLGRSARLQVSLFAGDRFELPRATLVALTGNLSGLPTILADSHRYLKLVDRARVLIAFGVFVSVAAVFLGLFSPVAAGVSLTMVAAALLLF